MALEHHKWDAQVGDVAALAPFPVVLSDVGPAAGVNPPVRDGIHGVLRRACEMKSRTAGP